MCTKSILINAVCKIEIEKENEEEQNARNQIKSKRKTPKTEIKKEKVKKVFKQIHIQALFQIFLVMLRLCFRPIHVQ